LSEKGTFSKMTMKLTSLTVGAWLVGALLLASPAAAFEVTAFDGLVQESDGSAVVQAGAHPFEATNSFSLNTVPDPIGGTEIPEENIKDVEVALPAGMIGNPTATPKCVNADLANAGVPACSPNSQVGVASLAFNLFGGVQQANIPIFNMEPPPGVPAEFGFVIVGTPVYITPKLLPDREYALALELKSVSQALALIRSDIRFWGVPGDPAHTPERGFNEFGQACADPTTDPASCTNEFTAPIKPFVVNPTACSADPLTTGLKLNTWQNPDVFTEKSFDSHDSQTPPNPVGITGCNDARLNFEPTLTARPTNTRADSETGLEVDLQLPQKDDTVADAEDLYTGSGEEAAIAVPALHTAVVELPAGISINPAAANGLGACTEEQIELGGPEPARCPPESKLGTAEIVSPIFEHTLPGEIFLAQPKRNKFGALLALYVVIDDPATGTVIKLPGRLDAAPQSGQLTARFDENPQLPFSDLELNFFGGAGAALKTPETCGTYGVTGEFSPWSAADPDNPTSAETVGSSDSFTLNGGAGGQPCAAPRFAPTARAGSGAPAAGQFSPFVLRLDRAEGEQRFATVNANLPEGLLARLKGVPYCSDASLSQIPTAEGTGAAQAATPSCSAASQVGVLTTGLGAGARPFFAGGKVYLAGPYKGAPVSLALVVPALAGPFDLGNVVVRAALQIDPETAQVRVVSDPIPSILQGIPLDIRSILVDINRDQFTVNPTDCEPASVEGSAGSQRGLVAQFSSRFQVGGCADLRFKPRISLSLRGPTKRSGHPALRTVVKYPAGGGYANVARASVQLPPSLLFENANLKRVCTRPQFAAGECPRSAIYGSAAVTTPLLDEPLTGPVYLRTSGGQRALPDLVADLDGQIEIDLVGQIDSKNRGLRATFVGVPDAPIEKFTLSLLGGRKSLVVNSTDICARKQRAAVLFTGQNGKVASSRPAVRASCSRR
jgi:hypothetical protein